MLTENTRKRLQNRGCFYKRQMHVFHLVLSLNKFQYNVTTKKLRNQFGYGAINNSIE